MLKLCAWVGGADERASTAAIIFHLSSRIRFTGFGCSPPRRAARRWEPRGTAILLPDGRSEAEFSNSTSGKLPVYRMQLMAP